VKTASSLALGSRTAQTPGIKTGSKQPQFCQSGRVRALERLKKTSMTPVDISGKRYGRLIAVSSVVSPKKVFNTGRPRQGRQWKFLCDCGNTKIFFLSAVWGHDGPLARISCGCLREENARRRRVKQGSISLASRALKRLYSSHQTLARKYNRPFLTREGWDSLVFNPCFYCGNTDRRSLDGYLKPTERSPDSNNPAVVLAVNGVDRTDSAVGYVSSNCVPCCQLCNLSKRSLTAGEFIRHCQRVVEHVKGGK
jgi:hypothetical protein